MTHSVRMDELPVNGDHEFVHHEELLEALSRGEKSSLPTISIIWTCGMMRRMLCS